MRKSIRTPDSPHDLEVDAADVVEEPLLPVDEHPARQAFHPEGGTASGVLLLVGVCCGLDGRRRGLVRLLLLVRLLIDVSMLRLLLLELFALSLLLLLQMRRSAGALGPWLTLPLCERFGVTREK